MTKFNKAHWSVDDKTVQLGVEFSKVNKQKRLVSGWATLDNVDTENDVVTAEASADAFARARGNLREMHKKDSAVGRIVSFKEDEFRAPDGNRYRGIFVTARVSEGAQDTWLKVLDGTLSGFSIGGNIVEAEEVFQKDSGETIRKVTKYDLSELSLVDNPGNQLANVERIFKIQKSADGSVTSLTGMIEDHRVYNVFFCNEHKITQEKPDDSYNCPVCSEKMEVIGFVEDGADRDEKVKAVVTKHLGGDNTMTKNNKEEELESEETANDAGNPNEIPVPTETSEEAREAGVDVDEVGDENSSPAYEDAQPATSVDEVDDVDDLTKQIDGLKKSIEEILGNHSAKTDEKFAAIEKAVSETREFFDNKISELDHKVQKFDNDLEATKSRIVSFEKKLDKVNSSSAFKKSVDSDDDAETAQKSETTWGGHFSDPRGAFSVDNMLR